MVDVYLRGWKWCNSFDTNMNTTLSDTNWTNTKVMMVISKERKIIWKLLFPIIWNVINWKTLNIGKHIIINIIWWLIKNNIYFCFDYLFPFISVKDVSFMLHFLHALYRFILFENPKFHLKQMCKYFQHLRTE